MLTYSIKYGRWLLFLAGFILFGCTSLPQQEKAIWPWEYGGDKGRVATGNYIGIRAGVANFGEPPQAVQPITPEAPGTHSPEVHPAAETPAAKTQPPVASKPDPDEITGKPKRDYDFTVSEHKAVPPSYLPVDSVRTSYDITAFNHGNAPVSVAVNIDQNATQNMSADKALPLYAVVPPNSDQNLTRFSPEKKDQAYKFNYIYSWSIGDYTARHHCLEHYRFPFKENIQAFASVDDSSDATPYLRYAIVFYMPKDTPVVAARKGTVIRIKPDDTIDILHEDATIGTYNHLASIAADMIVGKAVATGDVIGIAGVTENQKGAYLQLTVWRPEPPATASPRINSPNGGFDSVSFPLEFCSADSGKCQVLTQSQPVSRSKLAASSKQAKRKLRPATRKDGGQ